MRTYFRAFEDSGVIFIKIPITLQKVHFATKVRTLFIMVGLLYNHALTLVLNLIDSSLAFFSHLHCHISFIIGKMRPFVLIED